MKLKFPQSILTFKKNLKIRLIYYLLIRILWRTYYIIKRKNI